MPIRGALLPRNAGLEHEARMTRIYLVDLDGVVVEPGTQVLLPGAADKA